jgi:hypothetical protein
MDFFLLFMDNIFFLLLCCLLIFDGIIAIVNFTQLSVRFYYMTLKSIGLFFTGS